MKNLSVWMFAIVALGMTAGSARADNNPQNEYRYKVVYRNWDRGFGDYYSYKETCRSTSNGYFTSTTCYDSFQPNDYVYVSEQRTNGGYTRVNVYRDEAGTDAYAQYYVYDDYNGNRRVEHRHFYHNSYCDDDWSDNRYYGTDEVVYVNIDWSTGWGKVIVGGYTTLIGLDILANCGNDDQVCEGIGLAIAGVGSVSMSLGSRQNHNESMLQKKIDQDSNGNGNNVN